MPGQRSDEPVELQHELTGCPLDCRRGLFSSCATPAVSVPSWTIRSWCRSRSWFSRVRRSRVLKTDRATDGLVASRSSRAALEIDSRWAGVRARTVAERGASDERHLAENPALALYRDQRGVGRPHDVQLASRHDVRPVPWLPLPEEHLTRFQLDFQPRHRPEPGPRRTGRRRGTCRKRSNTAASHRPEVPVNECDRGSTLPDG